MNRAALQHAPQSARKQASGVGALRIAPANDAFEQEADQAAERINSGEGGRLSWSLSRVGFGPPEGNGPPGPFGANSNTASTLANASRRTVLPAPRAPVLQAKLRVSQPWDQTEIEAESAAERISAGEAVAVTAHPGHDMIHRQADDAGEEPTFTITMGAAGRDAAESPAEDLAAKPVGTRAKAPSEQTETDISASAGRGFPLAPVQRQRFEVGLGVDLSAVRIHTGLQAERITHSIDAIAATHGQNIYFSPGAYSPNSSAGQRLLAHELVHTVQQSRAAPFLQRQPQPALRQSQTVPPKPSIAAVYVFKIKVTTTVESKDEALVTVFSQIFGVGRAAAAALIAKHHASFTDYDPDKLKGKSSYQIWFDRTLYSKIVEGTTESPDAAKQAADKKAARERSQALQSLPKSEQQKINKEADDEFWKRTQYKPGEKLDPAKSAVDKAQADLWLKIRDQILKIRQKLGALPPAIRTTLGDPSKYTPAQYEQLLRIGGKLEKLSAEDLLFYGLIATATTTDLDAVERGLDQFIEFKEKYRQALDKNATTSPTKGGGPPAPGAPTAQKEPSLEEQLAKPWEGFDKAHFGGMSEEEKTATARDIATQRAGTQLKYMASHPGETAIGMAKGLEPGEIEKSIEKDLTTFKNSESSWGKWAAGTGITGKAAGVIAALATVAWIVMWVIPGVNLATMMATALSIAMYAGISAVLLSGASAELHIRAAGSAKTEGEFERQTNAASEELTNFVLGGVLLAAAFVLKLLGRIKFIQRNFNIGKFLTDAKNTAWAGLGVDALKAVRQQAIAGIEAELASLDAELKTAQGEHAALRKEIEALSPPDLMTKIATDPAFAGELGLTPEQAKAFGPAAKGVLAEQGAPKAKAQLLQAMDDAANQAQARVDGYKAGVQKVISDLNAARDQASFDAAVDRGSKITAPEEQARISQEASEAFKQKKLQSAMDDLQKQADQARADAKAKMEARRAAQLENQRKADMAAAKSDPKKYPAKSSPDRTWLEEDKTGRRDDLAYDWGQKTFKVREAKAALAAEQQGTLKPPVKRIPSPSETGYDFVDGGGEQWDHVRVTDASTANGTIASKVNAGENALVDLMDLTPADAQKVISAWNAAPHPAGSPKVAFVMPP
jgi:hypothetical protein